MKKPYIILIEAQERTQAAEVMGALRQTLAKDNLTVYTTQLPSDGPLGHLLRVANQDRVKFDFFAGTALSVIDGMDYFFNPANGIVKNNQEVNVILIEGFCVRTFAKINQDQSKIEWFSTIFSIWPEPQAIIHIAEEQSQIYFLTQIWNNPRLMSPEEFNQHGNMLISAWMQEHQ